MPPLPCVFEWLLHLAATKGSKITPSSSAAAIALRSSNVLELRLTSNNLLAEAWWRRMKATMRRWQQEKRSERHNSKESVTQPLPRTLQTSQGFFFGARNRILAWVESCASSVQMRMCGAEPTEHLPRATMPDGETWYACTRCGSTGRSRTWLVSSKLSVQPWPRQRPTPLLHGAPASVGNSHWLVRVCVL